MKIYTYNISFFFIKEICVLRNGVIIYISTLFLEKVYSHPVDFGCPRKCVFVINCIDPSIVNHSMPVDFGGIER